MSAGGLSYSMLTTNPKATLPSVEMWGTNMNILRDPPSGIYTRRIDKVGDTQGVLLSQDSSGDRIAEVINVYARGVNPMVSVSYNNNSNNAGALSSLKNIQSAKLPYRPEVFYPPVRRQEDLTPLSRLPRNWFYALTNPIVPNILSQMSCPETKYCVQKNRQNIDATTNIQYDLKSTDRQNNIDVLNQLNKIEKNPQRRFETSKLSDYRDNRSDFQHLDPKHARELRQYELNIAKSESHVGDAVHLIQHLDKKSLNENKLLYSAFSNQSSNKNIGNHRDLVQKNDKKALLDWAPIHNVVSNTSSFEKTSHPSGGVRGNINQNTMTIQVDAGFGPNTKLYSEDVAGFTHLNKSINAENRFGEWVVSGESKPHHGGEVQMNNVPKESTNARLNTMADTTPSMTKFWKNVEPIFDSRQNIKDLQTMEHPGTRTMTSLENYVESESLNRNVPRSAPHVWTDTNKTSLSDQSIRTDTIGSGRISDTPLMTYEGRPSYDLRTDSNPDVAIKTRDQLNIPVYSSSGTDRLNMGLAGFQDSQQRTAIDDLFTHKSANTNLKFYDKQGELGYREDNERRGLCIQDKETVHDRRSFGLEFYSAVQATDAKNYTNPDSASYGSFESLGSSISRFDRTHENGGNLPISDKFIDIKKMAVSQFTDRFQSDNYKS